MRPASASRPAHHAPSATETDLLDDGFQDDQITSASSRASVTTAGGAQLCTTTTDPAPPSLRKRVGLPDRVKQLESQLQSAAKVLQQLTIENIRSQERARMADLLLEVQTRLHDCRVEVCMAMARNPFHLIGATVEDVRRQPPSWMVRVVARPIRDIERLAASAAPLLAAHPRLLGPPGPLPPRPVHEGLRRDVLTGSDPLLAFQPADPTAAEQLRNLVQLCDVAVRFLVMARYAALVRPESMVGMAGRWDAVEAAGSFWDVCATISREASAAATAGAPKKSGDASQIVATEAHWRQVVARLSLSDRQVLQAAVLQDICIVARRAVAERRAALVTDLALHRERMQQQCTGMGARAGGAGKRVDGCVDGSPDSLTSLRISALTHVMNKGPAELDLEQRLLARLEDTLAQDRLLLLLASEVVTMHVLSPLQTGLLMAYACPYVVDVWAVLHVAAERCTPGLLSRLAPSGQQKGGVS